MREGVTKMMMLVILAGGTWLLGSAVALEYFLMAFGVWPSHHPSLSAFEALSLMVAGWALWRTLPRG